MESATSYGYDCLIFTTKDSKRDLSKTISKVLSLRPTGVIIFNDSLKEEEFEELINFDIPVVTLGMDLKNVSSVSWHYKAQIVDLVNDALNRNKEVFFISAKKKYNINKIFKLMEEHDCIESYVLGFTNSGKSSLINTINAGVATITISNMLNTTIDFIKMNIDGKTIIDSPGFNYQKTLFDNQDFDLIKKIKVLISYR